MRNVCCNEKHYGCFELNDGDDEKKIPEPKAGHCKVILSTNIAECHPTVCKRNTPVVGWFHHPTRSSITIPDVRYVLDFGIVRKMVFDEERAMQSLCNTWSSQATCRQRRGRCGRLQEGVWGPQRRVEKGKH